MGFGESQTALTTRRSTARHLFAPLFVTRKNKPFFILELVNALNKECPLLIYSISEKMITIVIAPIHLKTHISSLGSEHLMDQGRPIKHIQVTIRTEQSKKNMSYVQIPICNGLQNDKHISIFVSKIPLPSNGTIFPHIVHAIERREHAREPAITVNGQLLLKAFPCWLLEMMIFKLCLNCHTKSFHALHSRISLVLQYSSVTSPNKL
jgi:hypothetical protein